MEVASMTKITGIILVGTGSPANTGANSVRLFCQELLFDKRFSSGKKLSWWFKVRAEALNSLTEQYVKWSRAIKADEGFPEDIVFESLCNQLQDRLDGHAYGSIYVRCSMLFGPRTMQAALKDLKALHVDSVIVLPLFPQGSLTSSLMVNDRVEEARKKIGFKRPITILDDYHDNDAYIKAIAGSI